MDGKIKTLFLICCILAIIAVVIGSLTATTLFRYEGAKKNPYYWCDATWQCCSTDNCAGQSKSGGLLMKDPTALYSPSDLLKPGSAYHQNCILPVKNAMLNYAAGSGTSQFDVGYLYNQTGWAGSGTHPWGAGCTGPGGEGKCADPTYNPQVAPNCPYFSTDAPSKGVYYGQIIPATYSSGNANNALPTGNDSGKSLTFQEQNWANGTPVGSNIPNLTAQIFSGQGSTTAGPQYYSANGYQCPFVGAVNKTTSTQVNSQNNTLAPSS